MAKYSISIPMKKLTDSILTPDNLDEDSCEILPKPGDNMFHNPYIKGRKG